MIPEMHAYPADVYPWMVPALPALEGRFGAPRSILGGGMFGQAFDMGGPVVKVTTSPGEVEAVRKVIELRKDGHELRGFVHLRYAEPANLGDFDVWIVSKKKRSPLWAVMKERVEPIDYKAIGRNLRRARFKHPDYKTIEELEEEGHTEFANPFELASETAQDWVEATPKGRARLVKEYRRWVGEIGDVDGFEDIASSMEEFLDLTGFPLFDVQLWNCGRILRGDRRIVCFDFMLPEVRTVRRGVNRWRPKI